jgi:Fe2+ transport system protein FeoA
MLMILQIAAGLVRRTRWAIRPRAVRIAPALRTGELLLAHVPLGETVELVRMEMPEDAAEPLLEYGLMPGCLVCPVRKAPSGDPILLVDGTLIALRRETAACLCVRYIAESN